MTRERQMTTPIDLDSLSRAEKLLLVQQLWDEIADDPATTELTTAQREELDRRLDRLKAEPGEELSWEETVAWIRRTRGR